MTLFPDTTLRTRLWYKNPWEIHCKNGQENLPGWDIILASSDINATLSSLDHWAKSSSSSTPNTWFLHWCELVTLLDSECPGGANSTSMPSHRHLLQTEAGQQMSVGFTGGTAWTGGHPSHGGASWETT